MQLLRNNRRFASMLCAVLLLSLLAALYPLGAAAASTSLSVSSATAYVGKTVTVTVSSSSGEVSGIKLNLVYDADILEFVSVSDVPGMSFKPPSGSGGALQVEGAYGTNPVKGKISLQLTFKALKQGTSAIRFAACEVYDSDVNGMDISSTSDGSVKVLTPSPDATLKSLKVGSGTLTPDFSPKTTGYTLAVDNSVSKLAVSAVPNNSSAKVAVSGNSRLSVGKNTVTVKVTAGDGSVNTYTITVTRAAGEASSATADTTQASGPPAPTVTLPDGSELPMGTFTDEQIPKGFSRVTLSFGGQEIEAIAYNDIQLVYLAGDERHAAGFYRLNTAAGTASPLVSLTVPAADYLLVDVGAEDPVPAGYVRKTVEIGGAEVAVYVPEGVSGPEYYLLYAVDAAGKLGVYRYDTADGTLQRGTLPDAAETEEETSSEPFLMGGILPAGSVLPLLGGTAVVLLFTTLLLAILLAVKSRRLHKAVSPDSSRECGNEGTQANDLVVKPEGPAFQENDPPAVPLKPAAPLFSSPPAGDDSFNLDEILQEFSDKHKQ